jgi:hypothetical protein
MHHRRRFLSNSAFGVLAFFGLGSLLKYPAWAGLFDWIDDSPISPSSTAVPSTAATFQEVYDGAIAITRDQLLKLQNGQVSRWSDLADKPYGRLISADGLEHYYFKFGFGDGGVILISDANGIVMDSRIEPRQITPDFVPADMSEYVYYPPKRVETIATNPPPPPLPQQGCY